MGEMDKDKRYEGKGCNEEAGGGEAVWSVWCPKNTPVTTGGREITYIFLVKKKNRTTLSGNQHEINTSRSCCGQMLMYFMFFLKSSD